MDDILEEKGIIVNLKDGISIVELSQQSFSIGLDRVPIDNAHVVDSSMEMRSDNFNYVYGNGKQQEFITLKYNNISNPFTIKAGDLLAIPRFDLLNDVTSTSSSRSKENPKSEDNKQNIKEVFKQLINFTDRENTNDNTFDKFKDKYTKLNQIKKQQDLDKLKDSVSNGDGFNNVTEDLLPPNIVDGGKGEVTILENGNIILGTSVAGTESTCATKTTTKTELINSLLKNRVVR